jgi:hypothetical protein
MTLTYRRLSEFVNAASVWLNANPSGHEKFAYALKKLVKQGRQKFMGYEEQIEDIGITHAAVDERGVILRDAKGDLQYTPDGLKAKIAASRALSSSEVSFQTHYVDPSAVPELDEDYLEVFEGIVLRPDDGFRIVPSPKVEESDPEMVYDIHSDAKIRKGDRHIEAPEMVDA